MTHCQTKGCTIVLQKPNDPDDPTGPPISSIHVTFLELELLRLKEEYSLAHAGLSKGKTALPLIIANYIDNYT